MRLFQSIFSFKTQFLLYLKEESESVRMKQVSAFYEAENRVKIQKRIFKSYTARGAILWFFKKSKILNYCCSIIVLFETLIW